MSPFKLPYNLVPIRGFVGPTTLCPYATPEPLNLPVLPEGTPPNVLVPHYVAMRFGEVYAATTFLSPIVVEEREISLVEAPPVEAVVEAPPVEAVVEAPPVEAVVEAPPVEAVVEAPPVEAVVVEQPKAKKAPQKRAPNKKPTTKPKKSKKAS